jgi:predicted DsbA family dithiol-disulfide isomerase
MRRTVEAFEDPDKEAAAARRAGVTEVPVFVVTMSRVTGRLG